MKNESKVRSRLLVAKKERRTKANPRPIPARAVIVYFLVLAFLLMVSIHIMSFFNLSRFVLSMWLCALAFASLAQECLIFRNYHSGENSDLAQPDRPNPGGPAKKKGRVFVTYCNPYFFPLLAAICRDLLSIAALYSALVRLWTSDRWSLGDLTDAFPFSDGFDSFSLKDYSSATCTSCRAG